MIAFAGPASKRPTRSPSSRSRGARGGGGSIRRAYSDVTRGLCSRTVATRTLRPGRAQLRCCGCRQSVRGYDSGHGRRHEAKAVRALAGRPSRHGRNSRGDLRRVDRVAARDRELRCSRRGERGREWDPAHRHDELRRLVQSLELHRGPGAERDDHGVPPDRPGRLLEGEGLLHRR